MNYRVYKSDTKLDYDDYLDTESGYYLDAKVIEGHAQVYEVHAVEVSIMVASYPPGTWTKLVSISYDQ